MSAPSGRSRRAKEDVEGVVLGAGLGTRLGAGPKALVRLGGASLLATAVRVLEPHVKRVTVAVPRDAVDTARREVPPGTRVIEGGATRLESFLRLVEAASAPLIALHDVVHPLLDAELVARVIAAARRSGAAAAALSLRDFVFDADGTPVAGPGELWLSQKPIVFRLEDIRAGVRAHAELPKATMRREPGTIELLALVGRRTELVPGPPWNVKLTDAFDLRLVDALGHQSPPAGAAERSGPDAPEPAPRTRPPTGHPGRRAGGSS